MKKLYKVGIYCRLSVDDTSNSAKAKNYIPADESVSIENQYELLSKFVMLNGWTEVKSYRDDGYSGGNFQRPGFLEMLEDARHGLINLILVKDLSRLGRDFVEVGRYTDVIFPSLGCRFVSVLDCLDTEGDNTDMLHFRSLMNDYHLKDLSNKVKSVLHAKMRSGQYIAAYAPCPAAFLLSLQGRICSSEMDTAFFAPQSSMGGFRMAFSLFFSCFSRKLRANVLTFSFEFFVNLLHFWEYRLQFSVRCCIMKCGIYGL